MPAPKRQLRTIREASEQFGIRDRTIRGWVDSRVLWSTKVGGKVFIDARDLERQIQAGERPSVEQVLDRVLSKR